MRLNLIAIKKTTVFFFCFCFVLFLFFCLFVFFGFVCLFFFGFVCFFFWGGYHFADQFAISQKDGLEASCDMWEGPKYVSDGLHNWNCFQSLEIANIKKRKALNPAGNYMSKVNSRNTRTRCEIGCLIFIFYQKYFGVVLVSLLLTLYIFHTLF